MHSLTWYCIGFLTFYCDRPIFPERSITILWCYEFRINYYFQFFKRKSRLVYGHRQIMINGNKREEIAAYKSSMCIAITEIYWNFIGKVRHWQNKIIRVCCKWMFNFQMLDNIISNNFELTFDVSIHIIVRQCQQCWE